GVQPLALGSDRGFSLAHTYVRPGTYNLTVSVTDDDGAVGTDTMAVTISAPPTVKSVVINNGARQRSMVNQIKVTFSTHVTLDPGAFLLSGPNSAGVRIRVATTDVSGQTVAVLTFSGTGVVGGSLANGNYTLTIDGQRVRDRAG